MPRLVPKTHVENGVDNIDEDDLESEEEELDLGSDDKNQIPEFRATYQDESGRQVKLEQELWIKQHVTKE